MIDTRFVFKHDDQTRGTHNMHILQLVLDTHPDHRTRKHKTSYDRVVVVVVYIHLVITALRKESRCSN